MPHNVLKARIPFLLAGLLLFACQKNPEINDIKESILAFGTFVEVQVLDVPAEDKQTILDAIEKDLEFMHYAYHPWKSGPTGRTNQLLEFAG
jgi:thiamine biosynthesis lipoprotein